MSIDIHRRFHDVMPIRRESRQCPDGFVAEVLASGVVREGVGDIGERDSASSLANVNGMRYLDVGWREDARESRDGMLHAHRVKYSSSRRRRRQQLVDGSVDIEGVRRCRGAELGRVRGRRLNDGSVDPRTPVIRGAADSTCR